MDRDRPARQDADADLQLPGVHSRVACIVRVCTRTILSFEDTAFGFRANRWYGNPVGGARQSIPISKQGKKPASFRCCPCATPSIFRTSSTPSTSCARPRFASAAAQYGLGPAGSRPEPAGHGARGPHVGDLFRMGTLSEALQAVPMPDGSVRLALRGLTALHARPGS